MAIVHFARTKEEAEAEENATNIRLSKNYGEDLWLYDTHVGLCVKEREMNGYNDSDFYMTVYEPETDSFKEICFASTRGWTYPCLASKVDATLEVQEKYKQHLNKITEDRRKLREKLIAENPIKGKLVEVIRGRKHKGKKGIIFWRGVNRFRNLRYCNKNLLMNQVVGIEDNSTSERFFVQADYVKVINFGEE